MTVRRVVVALSGALVLAGCVVAFWPLHAQGVTGNAVVPHYGAFGWYAYRPLSGPTTIAALRRAGVHVPQDDVESRRRAAGALVAGGLVVAAGVGVATGRAVGAGRRGATGSAAG